MSKEQLIGEVFHYYGNKGVVYLKISGFLTAGQTLHFKDPDGDFFQTVDDIEVANQAVRFAYPGDFVGIPVAKPLHEHDQVFTVD